MAINVIETQTIFQNELDKQMTEISTTGWMEANAGQVKYTGGKEIKIPRINMGGMGDYSKTEGYPDGSVTLEYETKTMTQDRGRMFIIDAVDVEESNFIASAGNVMGEFQRTMVVPEVDAYRYSKIAALADAYKREYIPVVETIYGELLDDIAYVQDMVGENTPLVISISGKIATLLSKVSDISKRLDITSFKQGELQTKVKAIDDIPLLRIPSERMKNKYIFYDGKTVGQENGGFKAAEDTKEINWIVMPKAAPIAVTKTDKPKIILPEVNQDADAYKVGYRKYHDLWIKSSMLKAIRVNVGKQVG